jgi:hypothetical protein
MTFNLKEFAGISDFIKHHERLIIVLAVLATGYFGYSRFINWQEGVAQRKADASAQALASQKEVVAQLQASQVQKDAAAQQAVQQYQNMVVTLTAQNEKLANTISTLQAGLIIRKTANDKLDAIGMATRLSVLENLPVGNATANGDMLSLSNAASHQILNDLETVPVSKQIITAKDTELKNKDIQIAGLQAVVMAQAEQIGTLKETVKEQIKALADSEANTVKQIELQKQKDRKSRWGWLKFGFVTGFVSGLATGHFAPI